MKPYHAGQKAFRSPKFYRGEKGHLVQEANPYTEGSKDYNDWNFGYDKAYYDNLAKVQEREARTGG